MQGLKGKNVLVTGGSSGIGQAIAIRFGQEGSNVAIHYRKGLDEAKQTEAAIKEAKAGRVEFRLDKTANIHASVGKASFDAQQLYENFAALMDAVHKARPAGAKGEYIKRITLTTTMGPGIKVNASETLKLEVTE